METMNGPTPALLKLGTLGNSATFAGEAADRIGQLYAGLGEMSYCKSIPELWAALDAGGVDAIVIGIERSGQPHDGQRLATARYQVLGQLVLPIACNLYVKPGTRKEHVRKILGHGSILQCTAYLDANFPEVPREVHAHNSVAAAADVLQGDGDLAVVGTRSVGQVVPGLETYAQRIDSGALSSWWLITKLGPEATCGTTVMAAGRFGPDGNLSEYISQMAAAGCALTSIAGFACDAGISTYDYVLSFVNPSADPGRAREVTSRFAGTKVIGAFQQFTELA